MALVEGTGINGVLLVGASERTLHHKMAYRLLKRAGLERNDFLLTSCENQNILGLLKERPDIKAVVGLGEGALGRLLGVSGLQRWRGRFAQNAMGTWVTTTFQPEELVAHKHPPSDFTVLRHPPRYSGLWMWDIHRALEVAKNGYSRTEGRYVCDPTPQMFEWWAQQYFSWLQQHPDCYLSWDIETPYKMKSGDEGEFNEADFDRHILRVSFAYKPYEAVSVPWTGARLPVIRKLLAAGGKKIVWNGTSFDIPIVEAEGFAVGGTIFDMMDGWHVYQSDLDKGLEFVSSVATDLLPWKHLSNAEPARYSAIDADAALRNGLWIEDALKTSGQWQTFLDHSVKLMPVLHRAGRRGNYVNDPERRRLAEEWKKEQEALIESVQPMVPLVLRPRKVFKKQQPAAPFEVVSVPGKVRRCTHCGAEGVTKALHLKGGKKNPCKAAGATVVQVAGMVEEFRQILPFNPNSSEQLKEFMRFHGHPVGKHPKDQDKETADQKHLEKLVKKYGEDFPIYSVILQIHKISKAVSTLDSFTPDAMGKVYTTYVNSPSTWRLGSRDVNMQNVGKRATNPYTAKARGIIIASPGHILVQADSSSIEAVMVGWFMQDTAYIDLARKGVHDFLTCYELGIPFTKEAIEGFKHSPVPNPIPSSWGWHITYNEVGEEVARRPFTSAEMYKLTRDKCKKVVHGTNYGMGPWLMTQDNPELFPTLKEAKRMQDVLFTAIPNLRTWQHETRVRAQKETYLENPWKHRHYFYDVFQRDASGKVKWGKDAKRAVAYLPQSGAGCFMRDNLLLLGQSEFAQWMPANVSVHDGYVLDVPDRNGWPQRAKEFLVELLTRPIPQMGGLQIGCAVEEGYDWGKGMQEVQVVQVGMAA